MRTIILIIITFTFLLGCKKKESSPPANTTSSTGGAPILSGDHGTFLSAYTTTDFGNNSFYLDSTVQASFYIAPSATNSIVSAGTVSVNNIVLSQYSNNVYNSSNQINLKTLSWQIAGSGTIAATNFSYVPVYPIYNGSALLPDTVTKTSGFTFSVTGISNVNDLVYITIGQSGTPITKTLTSTPAVVNVSTTELAAFSTGNGLFIRLTLFNYSYVTLNSKQYGINSNKTYMKYCYLK